MLVKQQEQLLQAQDGVRNEPRREIQQTAVQKRTIDPAGKRANHEEAKLQQLRVRC